MPEPTFEQVRTEIRQLTSLPARSISLLGAGTESVAYLVDDEWVARFPMVPAARVSLEKELALLDRLGEAITLPIPKFQHVGHRNGELRFSCYRLLQGEQLTTSLFEALPVAEQDGLLKALAAFLDELHMFDVAVARTAGVSEEVCKGAYNPKQRDLHRKLSHRLTTSELTQIEQEFETFIREHSPAKGRTSLLHGDLKPEHVLYDRSSQRLTGVIDWGDVCLGDPDFDLAIIALFFGNDFLNRLLAHMPDRDPATTAAKIHFFIIVRWLQDLREFDAAGDEPFVAYCLQALREHLDSG